MADEDANRQRMEDMLKADDKRRPSGGATAEHDRPGTDDSAGSAGTSATPSTERAPSAARDEPAGDPVRAAKLAKAGIIVGALSIPGALFPIVGVVLGIAAIVLGVIAGRAASGARGKIAIGLGIAGVVLALVIFAIALASA